MMTPESILWKRPVLIAIRYALYEDDSLELYFSSSYFRRIFIVFRNGICVSFFLFKELLIGVLIYSDYYSDQMVAH